MAGIIWEKFMTGLWNISVQAAIIFCVLLLVRTIFSLCRVPKKYACFLWMILFVRLLMPVQPESPVGLWTKDSMQRSFVENPVGYFQGVTVDETIFSPEELQGVDDIDGQEKLPGKEMQKETGAGAPGAIWLVLSAVWGTGCVGFLLYGGISCLCLKKKLRCSVKREDNCYLADGIPTAFVMGVFPPKIYLPSELGEEDLLYVIRHEKTHIKRRDHLVKMMAYLITCFYWFHPLVWAALILMSKDIELSCDEAVLRELGEGSRRMYADTLLRLSGGKRYFAGVPLAFGEGDTESRIRHIIRYRKPAVVAAVIAVVVLSCLTVCLLTGRPGVKEGEQSDNPVGTFPGEDGENGDSGAVSFGENTPDSVNSRFPESVELSSGHTVMVTGDVYNITITIDGEAYKMADLCGEVNALVDIREFGEYIVVEGHISPDNAYYGFYSTESKQWEWEYIGGLLTWDEDWETLENPMESVIYAEKSDSQGVICDWKTDKIAVFDLKDEYVYDLKRKGDNITITIANYEGGSRELIFDYKDSRYTLYYW